MKISLVLSCMLTSAAYGAAHSEQPVADGANTIKTASFAIPTHLQSQVAAGKVKWGITRQCGSAVEYGWIWENPMEEESYKANTIKTASFAVPTHLQSLVAAGKLKWGVIQCSGSSFVDHEYGWVPVEEEPTAHL